MTTGNSRQVDVELRLLQATDETLVFSFLTLAARMSDSGEAIQKALVDKDLVKYWQGFGRDGDFGVVATRRSDGVPVSCAWLRRFAREESGSTFVAAGVSELAFATIESERGCGVGSATLERLINVGHQSCSAISLSVRADNPAVRLYERFGFVRLREITNRVGTASLVMLRRW